MSAVNTYFFHEIDWDDEESRIEATVREVKVDWRRQLQLARLSSRKYFEIAIRKCKETES
ncbi:predicted protein [Coccidioides posadasii str. Silveira]|uniref:Predicted protein n=1 Tax=Coccidioides posadasii (strain RMSCC 757 / Silveira) TaxID=443226 RepID=E9DGN9_COCPS|nr:predicted protein [Coccidioides posadasii str. Silveira]